MSNLQEIEQLRTALKEAEHVQAELDRRVFHLKTLYDVSKDIYGSVQTGTILRNFLLMTMGNFGVMEGFIVLLDAPSQSIGQLVYIGMRESDVAALRKKVIELLARKGMAIWTDGGKNLANAHLWDNGMGFSVPIRVEYDCIAFLGLGAKLIKEPFNDDDKELLDTLVNNLAIALKNARSFEEIKELNEELVAKNEQLEKTLDDLKKALRKVEILEDVKVQLSKFVPNTVSRLIEKSPNGLIPESKEQDVSVLFLDIEGYTKMCEQLHGVEVNKVIENCFSAFMDAIFANNGDVNETAGDGLMVLFLNEDKQTNAREAVQTALKIREEAMRIKSEFKALSEPLTINMGINSGRALVGAAKFESYTGSRWTYTARGLVTNVAARLGAQATHGKIFLSESTAGRVKDQFNLTPLGSFKLKNIFKEIQIFQV
ncbi:MAG: adenylate/guanylate cyclase domain-containing protein [Desulfobacterales bacterium]|nr:adenylate/guanylate cyclase domain-containing protein [Desulfobacterales bacterium]